MKPKPIKLYVLAIDNDSGISCSAHATKKGATQALYTYVGENWGEMNTSDPIPANQQEAIDQYFARDDGDDRAEIEAVTLED